MNAATRKALATALRAAAEALETDEPAPAATSNGARYYTRSTAPVEAKVWDRAIREIPAYKPGREVLVLRDDLHRWVEAHAITRAPAAPANDDAPLPYSLLRGAS